MGSVKDLETSPGTLGGRLYIKPTNRSLGRGSWVVSGRFSVADLKGVIPGLEIKQKDTSLAMTSAFYQEQAQNAGFQGTYEGMMDHDGNVVSVQTLLDRGELSNIVVMKLAITPHNLAKKFTNRTLGWYYTKIATGNLRVYIANGECIFRRGFPLGSSTFKAIFKAAGMGDVYEQSATYDETVGGLNRIRRIEGILDLPAMQKVLRKAGLGHIPNPGYIMDEATLSFTSKYDPGGDKDIDTAELQQRMGIDDLRFAGWLATLKANAQHQWDFCQEADIVNIDGKTEAAVVHGYPVFSDFACTIDENRLMIRYQPATAGSVLLIPSNKEIQRAIFRARGIYQAKEQAMKDHGDTWLDYIYQYVTADQIQEATQESVWMMEQAVATVANRILGKNVFDAKPIDQWVGPFLPYASVEQYATS